MPVTCRLIRYIRRNWSTRTMSQEMAGVIRRYLLAEYLVELSATDLRNIMALRPSQRFFLAAGTLFLSWGLDAEGNANVELATAGFTCVARYYLEEGGFNNAYGPTNHEPIPRYV